MIAYSCEQPRRRVDALPRGDVQFAPELELPTNSAMTQASAAAPCLGLVFKLDLRTLATAIILIDIQHHANEVLLCASGGNNSHTPPNTDSRRATS